jgi:AcrR family transcriptional regulator
VSAHADSGRQSPQPKQHRSEESTKRLIEAAARLIAANGYDRTTVAEIGREAGYSHGLVSQRFGSKEGLLWALIEQWTVVWSEERLRPAIGASTGADALVVMLDAVRQSIRNRPERMRALYALMFEAFKPIPGLHDQVVGVHSGLRRQVERHVRAAASTDVLPAADPEVAGRLFVAVLRGAAYQWLLDPEFDIDGTLAAFGEQFRGFEAGSE